MGLFDSLWSGKGGKFLTEGKHNSNVQSQANGNKKLLHQLSLMGLNDDSTIKLEYFFYTNTKEKAEALNEELKGKGYDRTSVNKNEKDWCISGWTNKINMHPDNVDRWSTEMCNLGFKHDSEFDGWGTYPNQDEVEIEQGLDIEDYFNNALDLYEEGDLVRSEAYFSKAIELDPNIAADAFFNRGSIRDLRGNKLGAIEDYDKVVAKDPGSVAAYENRGAVKDDIGDYDGALADYNKAIEIDPESATAYFNRGNTHYRLGKKDEACIDWSKAKQLGDESAQQRLDDFCN
jgi:tetratricopeptide (TPR) repeat protein